MSDVSPGNSSAQERFDGVGRFLTAAAGVFAFVGGMGLIFAIVVTCVSIILKVTRRVLDFTVSGFANAEAWAGIKPILGEEELVQYAVGAALFSALPWVMIKRGHVRIDIFEPLFGGLFNRLLNLAADFSLLFVSYMILTRQWYLLFKKARRSQVPMPELVRFYAWSDYLCPWCWNASRRLERLADEYEGQIEIVWKAYLLRPVERRGRDVEKFRRYTEGWSGPGADPDAGEFNAWSSDESPPSTGRWARFRFRITILYIVYFEPTDT